MRIFKNKWFSRFAKKEGISDEALRGIVKELERGIWDADYGGDVYKKRVAREGEGKSGGYRTIILFRKGERAFFSYAFPKSNKGDIKEDEKRFYKEAAKENFRLTDEELAVLVESGRWIEISVEGAK